MPFLSREDGRRPWRLQHRQCCSFDRPTAATVPDGRIRRPHFCPPAFLQPQFPTPVISRDGVCRAVRLDASTIGGACMPRGVPDPFAAVAATSEIAPSPSSPSLLTTYIIMIAIVIVTFLITFLGTFIVPRRPRYPARYLTRYHSNRYQILPSASSSWSSSSSSSLSTPPRYHPRYHTWLPLLGTPHRLHRYLIPPSDRHPSPSRSVAGCSLRTARS